MNTTHCIAGIFEIKPDVFQARILFDGNTEPVDCLYRGTYSHVYQWLVRSYPNVVLKSPEEFQQELDHILIFQCRSDLRVYGTLLSEQLSDDEFEELVNQTEELSKWIEQETRALEEKYRELLPIPPTNKS